jgi:O-antigen ligase
MYHTGGYILLALAPSILVGLGTFDFEGWVLNVFGILLLALMLVFSARERWSIEKYCRVIQFGIMPVIPVLVYLTMKTPDFDKIDFTLSSNFKTSGAFGSNQVSTVLGVGMILTMLLMVLRRPLFSLRWLNFLLMAALLYRGFLTFSRGGILTTLVCLVVAIGPAAFTSLKSFLRFTVLLSLFIGFGLVIFVKVNDMTNNQLLLRYKGETIGTLTGSKQRSLNTITSGRTQIASTDIDMFKDHPVFGVGPGMSKDLRPSYGFAAIASHTEYTRLLSEHGVGGLAVVILLFVFPIWWLRRQKYMVWRVAIASIFLFALLTSLHSAMRTNTTIVCYVLAAIPVYVLHKRKKLANQ